MGNESQSKWAASARAPQIGLARPH